MRMCGAQMGDLRADQRALPPLCGAPGYRSYAHASLVSSKQLTSFSDFRMPFAHNDHLTLPEYCDYLSAYAQHFRLPERCKRWALGTRVVQVRRAREEEDGNHVVTWQGGEVESAHFDALALCTGLHVEPSVPEIPGLPHVSTAGAKAGKQDEKEQEYTPPNLTPDQARITTLHSATFKDPAIFTGKRVLIMGTGETGMDLVRTATLPCTISSADPPSAPPAPPARPHSPTWRSKPTPPRSYSALAAGSSPSPRSSPTSPSSANASRESYPSTVSSPTSARRPTSTPGSGLHAYAGS